jgi:tetratricopeptide (TPR) repeat protein
MGGDSDERARKPSTDGSGKSRSPGVKGADRRDPRSSPSGAAGSERSASGPSRASDVSVHEHEPRAGTDPWIVQWWSRQRHRHRVLIAVMSFLLVGVLGVVANTLSVWDAIRSRLPSAKVVVPMSGDIKVAVMQFSVFGSEDPQIAGPIARDLADSLFTELRAELRAYRKFDFDIQARSPTSVGEAPVASRPARIGQLKYVADSAHADVVVGANVVIASNRTVVMPEFYLSGPKMRDAEELSGYHTLGPVSEFGSPEDNPAVRREIRRSLLQQVRAITSFTLGLGLYNRGEFNEAKEQFAAALDAWVDDQDRALAYLFLGNTAGRSGDLLQAARYYDRAIEITPQYLRANLGLAELAYQEGRGTCAARSINAKKLKLALRLYQDVKERGHQAGALSLKASFGVGRVYLCMSQSGTGDHWAEAEREFRTVAATTGESQRAHELRSESYANLGLIYLPSKGAGQPESEYRRAAEAYLKAIDASPFPARQALFFSMIGYIYEQLGDNLEACKAHNEALKLDPGRDEYIANKSRLSGCR